MKVLSLKGASTLARAPFSAYVPGRPASVKALFAGSDDGKGRTEGGASPSIWRGAQEKQLLKQGNTGLGHHLLKQGSLLERRGRAGSATDRTRRDYQSAGATGPARVEPKSILREVSLVVERAASRASSPWTHVRLRASSVAEVSAASTPSFWRFLEAIIRDQWFWRLLREAA